MSFRAFSRNTECSFCSEFTPESELDFFEEQNLLIHNVLKGSSLSSRIIFENEYFVVIPTIGCFIEGYCLICTKDHYYSFREFLNNSGKEVFERFLAEFSLVYKEVYGEFLLFEHGSYNKHMKGGGCSDHAHIHVIPSKDIIFDPKASGFEGSSQELWFNEIDGEYLYFRQSGNSFLNQQAIIESQFLRRIFANILGVADFWDWRKYPFVENMQVTYRKLKKSYEKHLPK